jgi:hypothetical protein
MQKSRNANRFESSSAATGALSIYRPLSRFECRYRRILVSLSLAPDDRASLLLGFELASLYQSALTLLHVLPHPKSGLDAIDLLHGAVDALRRPSAAFRACDAARSEVCDFINEAVPAHLLNAVSWQEACRTGEFAETVVTHANASNADLVILTATASRWRLPRVLDMWTIRRRTRASVILIRPQLSHSCFNLRGDALSEVKKRA